MTKAELNAGGISNNAITKDLKKRLVRLAAKYETSDFLKSDPSQFLYYYKNPADIELCAFTASLLSFGNRKQFIPKIQFVMQQADLSGGIFTWIKNRDFEKTFSPDNNKKFYRFYSYKDFYLLFSLLSQILQTDETFGIFLNSKYNDLLNNNGTLTNFTDCSKIPSAKNAGSVNLADIISEYFANCKIVPSTKTSAKKDCVCFCAGWFATARLLTSDYGLGIQKKIYSFRSMSTFCKKPKNSTSFQKKKLQQEKLRKNLQTLQNRFSPKTLQNSTSLYSESA